MVCPPSPCTPASASTNTHMLASPMCPQLTTSEIALRERGAATEDVLGQLSALSTFCEGYVRKGRGRQASVAALGSALRVRLGGARVHLAALMDGG